MEPYPHPTLPQPGTDTAARRIAVVDMLRGAALLQLTLGCVLLWFHDSARFFGPDTPSVWITRHLAEAGALGLLVVMGMSVFFFRKYRFSADKYGIVVVSIGVFALYNAWFAPGLFFRTGGLAWLYWALLVPVLAAAGWLLGRLFQNRLLLDADDYALYMHRKHDFRKVLLVFGQSPLFFSLAMLALVQVLAWATALSSGFAWRSIVFTAGYAGLPRTFGYATPRIYLTAFCVLAVLYPVCKAYGRFKSAHPYGWLQYV